MTDSAVALTVLAGQPAADELAAVVVALVARAGGTGGPAGAARAAPGLWAARSRLMRAPVTAGPGAWRTSALPR